MAFESLDPYSEEVLVVLLELEKKHGRRSPLVSESFCEHFSLDPKRLNDWTENQTIDSLQLLRDEGYMAYSENYFSIFTLPKTDKYFAIQRNLLKRRRSEQIWDLIKIGFGAMLGIAGTLARDFFRC